MGNLRLEPMTGEQFVDYRRYTEEHFAQSMINAGRSEAEARAEAARSTSGLLPDGLATPEHHVWTAYDGDLDVGVLWLRIRGTSAFGFDLLVHEHLRRRGYGRAMMLAAEQKCREHGVVTIGLHVFAHNPGAVSLYEQMGFTVSSYNMSRTL
ncbi:N-acetyltransferase [Actinoplanes sp. M2I2]|uniref:GNAT family N-acetyltransferase n=1 Tax=Actinoplanes sp. M2I2 TaxID=1734444 RepID=UPI002020EA49|nr:GNAT family N-acetyltransferase [Actinoplanes sp. M2I2]